MNQHQQSTNHTQYIIPIFDRPVDYLGSTTSETGSPTSLSVSEHASTIKSEPNMAPSPYAGQTVTSATQVHLTFTQMPY